MQYTILILAKASHQWLSMTRTTRDQFIENELRPLLGHFSTAMTIKLYDCDFTHAAISDFIILETSDLEKFGYLVGYLRESKTFAVPYFEVKDIVIGVPNNFRGSIDIADITVNRS